MIDRFTSTPGFDVIGDVHGHADALEGLLGLMGYRQIDGAHRHPVRVAVFVGDLIDAGAHQVRTVQLVRAMVNAGSARVVMGNHEFNAIAWATIDPLTGKPAREHSEPNLVQHREFLAEVIEGSPLHRDLIEWFLDLPLWLEVELAGARLRVVPACWHEPSMDVLRPLLSPSGSMTADAVVAMSRRGSPFHTAMENVLKGPEVDISPFSYLDRRGKCRDAARLRWWVTGESTLREGVDIPSGCMTPDGTPSGELPVVLLPADRITYTDGVPVVVGHYWRTGRPAVFTPTIACVDHSVARNGPLVAYRWSGEPVLSDTDFVAQPVEHPDVDDVEGEVWPDE